MREGSYLNESEEICRKFFKIKKKKKMVAVYVYVIWNNELNLCVYCDSKKYIFNIFNIYSYFCWIKDASLCMIVIKEGSCKLLQLL